MRVSAAVAIALVAGAAAAWAQGPHNHGRSKQRCVMMRIPQAPPTNQSGDDASIESSQWVGRRAGLRSSGGSARPWRGSRLLRGQSLRGQGVAQRTGCGTRCLNPCGSAAAAAPLARQDTVGGPLSQPELDALRAALLDEYAADDFYTALLDRFGHSRKLANIREAERRHASALLGLFERYGVVPPARDEVAPSTVPDTWQVAMQQAVRLEIDNGRLYEQSIGAAEHEDIKAVFERLRYVSLNHHLPALQRAGGQAR